MTISEKSLGYAREVLDTLRRTKVRAELDHSSEKINAKVRLAETAKVPYMPVVGEREAEERTVALRAHGRKDLGKISLDELVRKFTAENREGGFV